MEQPVHQTGAAAEVRNAPKRGAIFIRTVPNVMKHFGCDAEAAMLYMDYRDEGHSSYVASVMAGLADPES